ncbi:hypothetical protein D3C72_1704950 [compost metagenome]
MPQVGGQIEIIAHAKGGIICHVGGALRLAAPQRQRHGARQVVRMDVAGEDIVLCPQRGRTPQQARDRRAPLAVACVNAGDTQHMHPRAAVLKTQGPASQLAFGIHPPQRTRRGSSEGHGLIHPGALPVAVHAAGRSVHQCWRTMGPPHQRPQQMVSAPVLHAGCSLAFGGCDGSRRRQMHHALRQPC